MIRNNILLVFTHALLAYGGWLIFNMPPSQKADMIEYSIIFSLLVFWVYYYVSMLFLKFESRAKNALSISLLPFLFIFSMVVGNQNTMQWLVMPYMFFDLLSQINNPNLIGFIGLLITLIIVYINIQYRNLPKARTVNKILIIIGIVFLYIGLPAIASTITIIETQLTDYTEIDRIHTEKRMPVIDPLHVTNERAKDDERQSEFKIEDDQSKKEIENILGVKLPKVDFEHYYLYVTAGYTLSKHGTEKTKEFSQHELVVYKVNKPIF